MMESVVKEGVAEMSARDLTKRVSEFVVNLSSDTLPERIVHKSRACLLDYFGYAWYGSVARPIRILFQTLADSGDCTIVGRDRTTSPLIAAFINGAMGHVAELDDTHRGSMAHIGDSVIPAALAVAEAVGGDGMTLLRAVVAGYDVAARAGESLMPSHYYRGWHPSATVNTLGAAAAAGVALGLSAQQMQHALGIAGTQICGNFAHIPERGMVKDFNPGRAAFSGLLAALLAKSGFTGATDFLENRHGLAMYGEIVRPEAFLDGLGERFKIEEVSHKMYTACRHIHSAIDAAIEIEATLKPRPENIDMVEIESWSHITFCDDPTPWRDAWYGPRFSAQFNVAVALLHGKAGIDALFEPHASLRLLEDADVQSLIQKTRVVVDPAMDESFPVLWPARVKVRLKDGRSAIVRKDVALGEPEVPVTYGDIVGKFRRLCALIGVPEQTQAQVLEAMARWPDIRVRELCGLLRRAPSQILAEELVL